MSKWQIVRETKPNEFEPTGEVYDDDAGPVDDHIAALQGKTGVCHGANLVEGKNQ